MNVFTLPPYIRRGISSQLHEKIMDHAIGLGYTAFELHATKAGEHMYLQNGFVAHGEPTYRRYFPKGQRY
jgi:GNAT superfamily N-acetyltransferase